MSLSGISALTKRIFEDKVTRIAGIDAEASPLMQALLQNRLPSRIGGLGEGTPVAVRINRAKIQWYAGGSEVSTPVSEKPITGLEKWSFGRVPMALWDTDLRKNVGYSAAQIADANTDIASFPADRNSALIDMLEDAADDAKASLVEDVDAAIHEGGKDAEGNKHTLGPDGLDQLFDETQSYATIAPGIGQFASDDPWAKVPRGDFGSLDVWIPTIYRSGEASATIAWDLIRPAIIETRRWGGPVFCELSQAMYATLSDDLRTNYHIVPNTPNPVFGHETITMDGATFAPGIHAPDDHIRIVNLRHTRLRFGLAQGESDMDMGEDATFTRLPAEMGNFKELTSDQMGLAVDWVVAVALVCRNRRTCIRVDNLED